MHCYRGTYTSKRKTGDILIVLAICLISSMFMSSTEVWLTYECCRTVPYREMGAFLWVHTLRWCAVRMSSVTPVESCLLRWCMVLGRSRWDTPGIIWLLFIFFPGLYDLLVPLIPAPWPEALLTTPALERSIIIYADCVWTDVVGTG